MYNFMSHEFTTVHLYVERNVFIDNDRHAEQVINEGLYYIREWLCRVSSHKSL